MTGGARARSGRSMVALASEIEDKDWPNARLVRWASWARCPMPGGVGTSEGYMREPTAPGHEGEPTVEIAQTDVAVAKMYVARPDYKKCFDRYYLNPAELSYHEIGMMVGMNEARVEAVVRQAKMLVGYHIRK